MNYGFFCDFHAALHLRGFRTSPVSAVVCFSGGYNRWVHTKLPHPHRILVHWPHPHHTVHLEDILRNTMTFSFKQKNDNLDEKKEYIHNFFI